LFSNNLRQSSGPIPDGSPIVMAMVGLVFI
jgi:hypothetical protein